MTDKKDIPTDKFASRRAYGIKEGDDYGLVGQVNSHVIRMELSLQKCNIGRLLLKKCDDTCLTIGSTPARQPLVWTFQDSDRFECIKLYTRNSIPVGIYMRTTAKKEYDAKAECGSTQEINIPIGNGEFVGIFGDADAVVESLGFAMRV